VRARARVRARFASIRARTRARARTRKRREGKGEFNPPCLVAGVVEFYLAAEGVVDVGAVSKDHGNAYRHNDS